MSKYTTELRFICESEAGYLEQQGYNKVNEIVQVARSKIFSFDYPIFDEEYRAGLETKILKHYYTREIAAETYGRWKLFLESRMLEIMPYYNQLYQSTLYDYDIFDDVNYLRSGNKTTDEDGTHQDRNVTDTDTTDRTTTNVSNVVDSENSNTTVVRSTTQDDGTVETDTTDTSQTQSSKTIDTDTSDTGLSWDKYSDTPQGSVQNIDNDSYLTNARKNTVNNTGTVDTTETGTIDNTSTTGVDTTTSNTQTIDSTTTDNGTLDTTETTEEIATSTGTLDTTFTNAGSHTKDVLEEYSELIKGKMPGKSYMQMIQEFRDIILNIDKMIIDDLADLFMMVY